MRLVTVAEMQEAEKRAEVNTAPRTEVRGSQKREPTIRRRENAA